MHRTSPSRDWVRAMAAILSFSESRFHENRRSAQPGRDARARSIKKILKFKIISSERTLGSTQSPVYGGSAGRPKRANSSAPEIQPPAFSGLSRSAVRNPVTAAIFPLAGETAITSIEAGMNRPTSSSYT